MHLFLWVYLVLSHQVGGSPLSKDEDLELERHLKFLNKPAVKTIQVNGEIFDCIDMNRQPALDHPLLKHHVVKMKPSSSPIVSNDGNSSVDTVLHIGQRGRRCPQGTVIIRSLKGGFNDKVKLLHTKVDLVITLGGDGTVLWAASMFKGPVPPVVPFSLGSLGFMTPFHSENYRDYLDTILKGPISITLRHRLQCHVIRDAAKDELETEEPIIVLNEVTIDRGISSYLTYLECYCDNSFVTLVQGDGLILSSTSGSTAYSLAAGGSMVHPQVPGILFTPICPHSLSFRPLILPEYVTLRVQVSSTAGGKLGHLFMARTGNSWLQVMLICSMAPWPVPTACQVDSTHDFLRSIHEGLHWNLRKSQSYDGPRDT